VSVEESDVTEVLDFNWPTSLQYASLQLSNHGLLSALTTDSVMVYFCSRQASDGAAENSS